MTEGKVEWKNTQRLLKLSLKQQILPASTSRWPDEFISPYLTSRRYKNAVLPCALWKSQNYFFQGLQ